MSSTEWEKEAEKEFHVVGERGRSTGFVKDLKQAKKSHDRDERQYSLAQKAFNGTTAPAALL
jgi:hypothetical protein